MNIEAKTEQVATPGKYLTFRVEKERYSLPVLKVREIMRLCPITTVPRMPSYLKGVINLRGKIVPIVDLRSRFHLPPLENNDRTCIVVVQLSTGSKGVMGVIVDAVEDVSSFTDADIEPTPDFGDLVETKFILGMSKSKGVVKTILDIDQILLVDGDLTLPIFEPSTESAPSAT